ncbi:protein ABHD11-like isoform X2 [Uloborus diversus]|uniref:protein ABHD11-like isoform X2 n=1 Tax=Uloborus diversus TaxID=327109 RepID=UPI002409B755|nr:protein ABHD11-like isoform X2 [Uloborus diversus]
MAPLQKLPYLVDSGNLSKTPRVYSLDLRNHGETPSSDDCDLYLMVEDVKVFLRDEGLSKVTFVCHSLSCTIGYLIALEHPEVVEKIVMIDHPPFSDPTITFFRDNVNPQFLAQNRFLKSLDPSLSLVDAKRKILDLSKGATKGQTLFLEKVAHDLTKEGNKFKWKTDIQFLIDRYKEGAFTVPHRGSSNHDILIIRCKDSLRISDLKFQAVLKHNPKARIITFDDTTHLLMLERQKDFVAEVKKFLSDESGLF